MKREQAARGRALLRPRRAARAGGVTRPRPHPPRRAADAASRRAASPSSTTCSGWRSSRARASPSSCAAGASTSPTASSSPRPRTSGIAHMALRAVEPGGARAPGRGDRGDGLGIGWIDGDHGHGPAYRFHDPDGHVMEVLFESRPLRRRPSTCARRCATSRSATRRAARRSSGSTTSTCWPATSPPAGSFATDVLGYRHYEGIVLDDGRETGAWLSLTIAAHELIYVERRPRRRRPPAPPRVLGRHARGVPARGGHLPRRRRPHRGGAVQARRRRRLLPLRLRARRQPDRGHDRRLPRLRPRRTSP